MCVAGSLLAAVRSERVPLMENEDAGQQPQRTVIEVAGAEHRAETLFAVYSEMHRRDSRVVALDADPLRPERPLPDEWRIDSDADTDLDERVGSVVAAIREEADAGREVHLIGFGLGAGVCIAAAARSRDSVSTLTTVAGWVTSDRLLQETIGLGASLWESDVLSAQRYSSLLEHSPQYRRHLGVAYDATVSAVPVADARVMRRLHTAYHLDIAEDAARVACPTLVIAPMRDLKVPPQHSHELYGAIVGSALLEVDAGHGVLVERISQVYSAHDRLIRAHVTPGSRLLPGRA